MSETKGKIYIQNIKNSEQRANLYTLYDREYRSSERYLWMSCDYGAGPTYYFSEHEARQWLDDTPMGRDWTSYDSRIYVIELPDVISTEILLSNNKQEKLKELVTMPIIEQLWQEQYSGAKNDST